MRFKEIQENLSKQERNSPEIAKKMKKSRAQNKEIMDVAKEVKAPPTSS